MIRRTLPKVQPRPRKPKEPGKSRTVRLLKKRSGGLCERCGAVGHSTHHRRNVSQGGEWSPQNCVRLCGSGSTLCHGWVGANPDAAHAEGFHLENGEDPAAVPIRSRLHGAVLLADDGTVTPIGDTE